jgi:hypothetical protein
MSVFKIQKNAFGTLIFSINKAEFDTPS